MIEIDADVLDLGERLMHGDELWRGDPTMSIQWNILSRKFEVWGEDVEGRPYMAWTGDECTPQMLVDLTEWDWARGPKAIIDKLAKDAAAKDAVERDRIEDLNAAFADKVGWTLDRVLNGRSAWGFTKRGGV